MPYCPRQTALDGLITAKKHQKVKQPMLFALKTSYSRVVDVAERVERAERRRTRKTVLNCSKF